MPIHEPMDVFQNYWRRALEDSPLQQKSAVCVSTIGRNGFPNSRYVDLKEADKRGLVFCTYLNSAKGQDIAQNAKAGLTVWWDHIGIQVRFQGTCEQISPEEAERHWKSRSRDAQLTTTIFRQSEPLQDLSKLAEKLEVTRAQHVGKDVDRPWNWGGYRLVPVSIEILEFKVDRLHLRTSYAWENGQWTIGYLQP